MSQQAGGLRLRPFRAVRYAATLAPRLGRLLAPPYDVIDDVLRSELEAADEHNAVRLILPRDDPGLPGSGYQSAARRLADWRAAGLLMADAQPAFYVYEERTADGHVQRGVVAAVALEPPDAGVILPHEDTMAGPVTDRLALMEATRANLEPIFLVYDGGGGTGPVAETSAVPPLVQAVTPDGVRHRVWPLTDPDRQRELAADLRTRRATIADGHHRYATYLRYQRDRRDAGEGAGPWDYGLAYLVDATVFGPRVQAIHRVVPGLPVQQAADRARAAFSVRSVDRASDEALSALADAGRVGPAFLIAGSTGRYLLTDPHPAAVQAAVPADRPSAWRGLDVTVAHHLLIRRLWGVTDDEEHIWYRHDVPGALSAATDSAGTALLLNPTPPAAVAAVAAEGGRMPRKSTLFTPKPASGLLLRLLADG